MHRVASLFFGVSSIGRLGSAHAFTAAPRDPCLSSRLDGSESPEFSSRSSRNDIVGRATAAALVAGLDENVEIVKSLEGGLGDPTGPSQCVDIARDLDGEPLSPEYLSTVLGVRVDSYECPESEAFRGLMSNGCRIRTSAGDTAFYKRIEFASLKHARDKLKMAPGKLKRDVKSYEVVTSFLSSRACQAVIDGADVHIPRCLDVNMRPDHEDPIRSQFSIMLEDFSVEKGWTQRWLLDSEDEVKASLGMFARLHAFFWQGSSFWENGEAADEFERGVWPSAGYSQPTLQSPDQWKEVAKGWAKHKLQCRSDLEQTSYWSNLGERLQESVAEEVGHLAHPFANEALREEYSKFRTFTHGDPKQSNLFFRVEGDDLQVGLIDFQWAGFGLAATDLAHFVTSAIHEDLLREDGEAKLLKFYFDTLTVHLVEYGAFDNAVSAAEGFSFDTFMEQYNIAVLDMCRLVISYNWRRYIPVTEGDEDGISRSMNLQSYNKNSKNAAWLMGKCDDLLRARGI
ncbi:hypothetical protein THAOC_21549 [Thalassiosira oceanica]|uniref:CHK kinase-like domain-containing protein n=1 Tax=Thalassiosira oceanica TaxID=159749 RepID=K0S0U8_THAOC|nr:hypothetical protein THAOC_21549 [Thalassiosira oceanica]|eukprot:EJK58339.1 hypothetical protein THAOC_21549 [Thalassiosira oceanica]